MDSERMREQVRKALGMQWDEFAARHPALARELDQEILTERCVRELREDQGFRDAMRDLDAMPLFVGDIEKVIVRIVGMWLGKL